MRTSLGESRFRAIIDRDAGVREVSREDVAEWLADRRAGARDTAEFRAAEREAAYLTSEERGGE